MIYTLPTLTLGLWFAEAAALLFLSALLIVGGCRHRYPHFAALMHYTTAGCAVLLLVARFGTYTNFRWSYLTYRMAWDILAALVAREVYINVFGPAWALPRSVPRRMAANLAIIVTSAAAIAVTLRASVGSMALRVGTTGEGAIYGALGAYFLVMFMLSRKLSITWHWRMKHIAGGMALILATNTITSFVRGHSPGFIARNVDDIGQVAYLLSFLFWSVKFLQVERSAPSRDPEILVTLAAQLKDAQSRARALGISVDGN